MTKFFIAILAVLLVSSCSFAGSIEIISLLDRTGENEPSLLIGATDEQIQKYLPDGKLKSQILAFYVKFGISQLNSQRTESILKTLKLF